MYEAAILPLDEKKYNVLAVEEIGKKMGVHVLRLPPYNCDMNPIEMAWSVTKGKAMKSFRNEEKTVVSVEKVLFRKPCLIIGNHSQVKNILDTMSSETARNQMEHVKKVEAVRNFYLSIYHKRYNCEDVPFSSSSSERLSSPSATRRLRPRADCRRRSPASRSRTYLQMKMLI